MIKLTAGSEQFGSDLNHENEISTKSNRKGVPYIKDVNDEMKRNWRDDDCVKKSFKLTGYFAGYQFAE